MGLVTLAGLRRWPVCRPRSWATWPLPAPPLTTRVALRPHNLEVATKAVVGTELLNEFGDGEQHGGVFERFEGVSGVGDDEEVPGGAFPVEIAGAEAYPPV